MHTLNRRRSVNTHHADDTTFLQPTLPGGLIAECLTLMKNLLVTDARQSEIANKHTGCNTVTDSGVILAPIGSPSCSCGWL